MSSKPTYIFILECLNVPGEIVLDKPEQNYSCGRGKENHIVCLGLTVSRKHCIFVRSKEELYVSDLKSSNGIYINGIKQAPHNMVKLHENDIIGIGCDFSTTHDKNMFAYKLRIIKQTVKADDSNCSALSSTIPVTKALERCSLDNGNSYISKRTNEDNCDIIVPCKIRKVEVSKQENKRFAENNHESPSKSDTNNKCADDEMEDIIIINDKIPKNTQEKLNSVDNLKTYSADSNTERKVTQPTVFSKLDHLLNVANMSPILKYEKNPNQHTAVSTFATSKVNPTTIATPVASRKMPDQNMDQGTLFHNIVNSTPKVHTVVAKDSLDLGPNFITDDGTVIKMEEELQITDTEESDLGISTVKSFEAAVSPIKLKKVKQETKTRFSIVDVVNLSDSEDDIFPCSQLFDNEFETNNKVDNKIEVKQEVIDTAFHTNHDPDEVILLSDSDEEENPWLERLSRSQIFNDDNSFDKSETKIEIPCTTVEAEEPTTSSATKNKSTVSIKELREPEIHNEAQEEPAAAPVRVSVDAATSMDESMSTEPTISKSALTNTSDNTSLSNRIQSILAAETTVTDSSVQTSEYDDSLGNSLNKSNASVSKMNLSGRKPPPIIEPPHLSKGRRKSISKTDEATEATKKTQMTVRRSTKEKKELEKKRKIDQYMHKQDQRRRRITHKWADCIPPSKAKGDSLSKEEKKLLANDRKAKLKKLTEEKAMGAENNEGVKRPIAKPKAKVSTKNRSDLLLDELQNTSTTRIINEKDAEPKADNLPSNKPVKLSASKNTTSSTVKETRSVQKLKAVQKKSNISNETDMNDVTRNLEQSLNLDDMRSLSEDINKKLSSNCSHSAETSPKALSSTKPKVKPVATVVPSKPMEPTTQPSIHGGVTNQNENCSPNRLGDKKNGAVKKRVTFCSKISEIREYQIDPHNTLNRLVGKDAPIPRDKLLRKPANSNIPCPKIEEFLLRIFQWNPIWLEEQRFLKTMAPAVRDSELRPLLSHYISFEEYYNIALPLLLLETWCSITKEFETKENNSKRPTMMCSIVENSIALSTVPSTTLQTSTLLLEVLVTKADLNRQCHPNYGDLVFFEYVKNVNGKQIFHKVFAYITDVHQTILTPHTFFNKDLRNYIKDAYALLTYTIMTKVLEKDIPTNRVQRLRSVTYLRASMRTVQALQYLPLSPLMNLILNPSTENFQLPPVKDGYEKTQLVTRDTLNPKQLEAVLRVTESVVRQEPKICLIHGPPGTGKSKVIVNIVTQILYGGNRYKNNKTSLRILVCAPSNAAIDEIVVRLLAIRSTFSHSRFRMVRLGRPETMHASAKHISVTELAKRDVKRTTSSYSSDAISEHNIEEEKVYLEAQINATKCEIASTQNRDEVYRKHLKTKLSDMTAKYELLQNRKMIGQMNSRDLKKLQRMAENRVLLGADIITCTLSSCYTNQMESLFGGNRERISVCIVDEATQSCEAETLIPLMLGVNTLVLVGDPNQLPATVLSQQAKRLGLDQSLFSRLHGVFESRPDNPVIMLDVQYRMADPISYWPNKYFYGGRIKNALTSSSHFPYHSYRVLNLDSNQNNDKFSNTDEAEFISNMIYCIIDNTDFKLSRNQMTVGILTPYNNQRSLILSKIHEKSQTLSEIKRKHVIVEVNTVDSFQGQERDIIVMSCVRSHGIGFLSDRQRLCVALTRAKRSLILCGNFTTFMRDPMWNALMSDAKCRRIFFNVPAKAPLPEIRPLIVKQPQRE